MNMFMFFGCLALLIFLSLLIGGHQKKKQQTDQDFYLSGRSLNYFGLTLSFLATQLGGGALIGAAQAAYEQGIYAIFYAIGLSLGLLILSTGIGSKFRTLDISTLPELFTKFYDSKWLRVVAGGISLVSLSLILVAIGVAARKFFLTMGLTSEIWFILFTCAGIFYTVIGGLSAVVKTDILQGLFIALVLLAALFFVDIPVVGSIETALTDKSIPWVDWILMPMLFVIIGQDMSQRCFAAKHPKIVSFATASSGILLLGLSVIPVVLGLAARQGLLGATFDQSVLMTYVMQASSGSFSALFAVAVLMAILSTMDSLICSISAHISYDLLPFLGMKQQKVWVARLITFLVGVIAMICSIGFQDIISLMVQAYKFSIFTLLAPILVTVFLPQARKNFVVGLMLLGGVLFYFTCID
jgi:SSS family solute:Na+ symporter